jgi:type II secretory pathway pseudopilin PulG
MDLTDTRLWILGIVAVLALLALAVWLRSRKKQSYQLEQSFGPEYGHAVDDLGSRANRP